MKKKISVSAILMMMFLTVTAYAQPPEALPAEEEIISGDMIEEEYIASSSEEKEGKLIITSLPVANTKIILSFSRENGDVFDVELEKQGITKVLLPEGNYHMSSQPQITYSEEYNSLNSLPLTYFARTEANPGGTFKVSHDEDTYLGTNDDPVVITYTYSENIMTDGEIKDTLIDPDILSYDPRLEKKASAQDTQELIRKEAEEGISKEYESEMSEYIKKLCEEDGIEVPDDSKIQSYGGYGKDPFGTKDTETTNKEVAPTSAAGSPASTVETLRREEVESKPLSTEIIASAEDPTQLNRSTIIALIAIGLLAILSIVIMTVIYRRDLLKDSGSKSPKKRVLIIVLCIVSIIILIITISKLTRYGRSSALSEEEKETISTQNQEDHKEGAGADTYRPAEEETYYNKYESSVKDTDKIKSVTITSGKGTRGRLVGLAIKSNGHISYNTNDTKETYDAGYYIYKNGRYYNPETNEYRDEEPEGMTDQGYVKWLFRNTFGNTPEGFESLTELYKNGEQISSEELEIGDIGMTYEDDRPDNRYGVFIGYSDSLPIFTYLSPIGDDTMPAGRNYIAVLKSAGETVIDGAYPIDLNYFVHPSVKWLKEMSE